MRCPQCGQKDCCGADMDPEIERLTAELAECREAARAAILALAHADEQSPGLYREAYEKLSAALAAKEE